MKGSDPLQDRPKEPPNEARRTQPANQVFSQPMLPNGGGSVLCCGRYLENTAVSLPAARYPQPRCASAETQRGSRAGARWRRFSEAVLPRLALQCPRVVSPWGSCLARPVPWVAAAPSPGCLHSLPRPSLARPLPGDPALHRARAKSPGV